MEIPYTGRAIITDNFNSTEIIIPAKKNWFIIIFLGFWLCAWVAAECFVTVMALGLTGKGPEPFLLVWLCFWTIGGFFAGRTFWWTLKGKEVITVGQGALTIDKKGALFYKAKTYDLNEANDFRAQEDYSYPGFSGPFAFGTTRGSIFNLDKTGTIRFDYGMQTVKFGAALDEAEAGYIIKRLRDKKLIS